VTEQWKAAGPGGFGAPGYLLILMHLSTELVQHVIIVFAASFVFFLSLFHVADVFKKEPDTACGLLSWSLSSSLLHEEEEDDELEEEEENAKLNDTTF
jgi:hypothetical protein